MKPEQHSDGRWYVVDEVGKRRDFVSLPAAKSWISERMKGVSVASS
jgi:hypothetical protein